MDWAKAINVIALSRRYLKLSLGRQQGLASIPFASLHRDCEFQKWLRIRGQILTAFLSLLLVILGSTIFLGS